MLLFLLLCYLVLNSVRIHLIQGTVYGRNMQKLQ